jgi:WD40 repeat protein
MIELTGHTGLVVALAYAPDGRTLASASADGTARLWDLATGRLLTTFQSLDDRAHAIAFAPDGKSLAVGYGNQDGLVQWWELNPLRRRESWKANTRVTRDLAFSPDGRRLATAGNDGLKLWDLDHFSSTARAVEPVPAQAVTFSPDGQFLAVLSGRPASIHLRRADAGRVRKTWLRLADWGYALAFSPDGRQIVCGLESEVAVWEPGAKRPPVRWPAHGGAVLGVSFTPDGRTLLTGGKDGLVKLWDPGGRLRHSFDWRIGDVGAVAFAPDGLTAAAGGFETILVWDVSE